MESARVEDQRKFVRYRAKDGAIALLRCASVCVGQILDISQGGLAFSYVDLGHEENGPCELDILLRGNGFHLRDVPGRTVSDLDLGNRPSFSPILLKRRSIQFGPLNSIQRSELEYFIQNYTTGTA